MDETLPGGPDPGNVGVFLYEADGAGGYTYVWSFVSRLKTIVCQGWLMVTLMEMANMRFILVL